MVDPTIQAILLLYAQRGGETYSEAFSQSEHAVKTAMLAEQSGAQPTLIAAALLHDAGHLIGRSGKDFAERGVDDRHERVGATWLSKSFPQAVTEPIRLHVPAKRYLCTTDSSYFEQLSPLSRSTLELQSGLMSSQEVRDFEAIPFAQDAVNLRRWDDSSKKGDAPNRSFESYEGLLRSLMTTPAE